MISSCQRHSHDVTVAGSVVNGTEGKFVSSHYSLHIQATRMCFSCSHYRYIQSCFNVVAIGIYSLVFM